jgi:hypothetical protein
VARKRDPNRPKKVVRRSGAPLVTPQRWFWVIVTFFAVLLGAFFLFGLVRRMF